MTLDEAIQHALEVGMHWKSQSSTCHAANECGKEHEQRAEWLIELKMRREGWIPVSDKLPMEGMDVLICKNDEWCKIASYHGNHWEDDSEKCVPECEITHWQYLPEPPKEE